MTWYTGDATYDTALTIGFGIVAVSMVSALFIQSPCGRFADESRGMSLNPGSAGS